MYPYPEQKIIHERSHAKCSALHRCYVSSSELLWVRLHLQLGWMNWFESPQEKTPGSYQFGRRHATIIFEDREHAWKNASIWLRKHVSFKMSHNLRGFSWIFLGAGSARHHKEHFFFRVWDLFILWGLKGCCSLFLEFCTLRGLAPNLRWNVMPNQKDSVWSVGSSYEINWDGRPVKNRKIQFGKKNTVKIVFQKCGSGLRSWSSWSSWACALRGAIEIEETLKVTKGPGRASGVFTCLKKHLGPVKLP